MDVLFPIPLIQGTVLNRPNRFVAEVQLGDNVVRAHTPVSGRIGGFTLNGLPCLLSGPYPNRGTEYTVEALGLQDVGSPDFQWVGINQNATNGHLEQLMLTGQLSEIFGEITSHRREVPAGGRRIDFQVNGELVEVKTPLLKIHAAADPLVPLKIFPPTPPSDRLPGQLQEMLAVSSSPKLLVCFYYRNTLGTAAEAQLNENINPEELLAAWAAGLEVWMLELSVSEGGVTLVHKVKM